MAYAGLGRARHIVAAVRQIALVLAEGWKAKRHYRVRLNGADHQWGKDPPKEVVG